MRKKTINQMKFRIIPMDIIKIKTIYKMIKYKMNINQNLISKKLKIQSRISKLQSSSHHFRLNMNI